MFAIKIENMKVKRTIIRIALVFMGILAFQKSFSQENYLQGYLISLKGDTIHGFINYRNWEKNPNEISFKEKIGDTHVNYSPINIKGFSVLDEKYESAIIETEITPNNTKDLNWDSELKIRIDTIFLQTMIVGRKSLYLYMNNIGNEQFYIKEDTTYKLLIHKKYLKLQDGLTVIADNNIYKGQLYTYLSDCSSIKPKMKELEYRKKSMENLFQYYYANTNSEIKFQKKNRKTNY